MVRGLSQHLLAFLALLVALAAPARAEPFVVSHELCNGLWIVPLTWTGKTGTAHELTAVFDTGGSNLLIDPDGLERVSDKRVAEGRRVRMEGVSASGLDFTTFRPRVREMSHLGAALGRDFDVFLPFSAFAGKLLVLDYPAREMRVGEGALPEPDGKSVFSARGPDKRPWLELDLAGRKRKILIDSGSNGRLALKKLGRLKWLEAPVLVGLSTRMDTVVQRHAGRIRGNLTIANLEFEQPIVSITEHTELMGVHVLKHLVLTFDQQNRRVAFDPATKSPVRMQPKRGTGAMLRADAEGFFEVAGILPGTPAEHADLRRGDRIVALNGVPTAERGCKKLDDPVRAQEVFGVQRGGGIEPISVEVIDLIE